MLALELSEFMVQLKDGTINNVGGPSKTASAKLFDVDDAEARAFGDSRVKIACADVTGNEVEIALRPDEIRTIEADIDALRAAGTVDGLE